MNITGLNVNIKAATPPMLFLFFGGIALLAGILILYFSGNNLDLTGWVAVVIAFLFAAFLFVLAYKSYETYVKKKYATSRSRKH